MTYELGEFEEFAYWGCSPPSHSASGCFLPTVIISVTGNTTVTSSVAGAATLVFGWDPRYAEAKSCVN